MIASLEPPAVIPFPTQQTVASPLKIKLGEDELRVCDETIAALAVRVDLFQRGNNLVEIVESPKPPPCIVRPEGGIRAVTISEPRLRELISDSARYRKLKTKGEDGETWARAGIPANLVKQVLCRGVWEGIAQLEGIVSSPQFLNDGSVLRKAGYCKRSGLYLTHPVSAAGFIENPTKQNAFSARDALLDVIADFPLDDVSRAGWLALVLTGASRHAIDGPTPLFAIDANVPGSGKSMLADVAGIIHTGVQLPRCAADCGDSEMRKRITAILMAGEPMTLLDNANGVLGCAALDALLTARTWSDRILGATKMSAVLPTSTIWIASGNNLQFAADTGRRTLRIRMDSALENPEERTGFRHPNLIDWVHRNRSQLAIAAATILRAWSLAGRPDMGLPPWGSFEAWSAIIRNAITWVEMADPGKSRQEIQRESDSDGRLLRNLLNAWRAADPDSKGMTVAVALKRAEAGDAALANAFDQMTGPSGKPNNRSIGMRLRHLRARVCGGLSLKSRDTNAGSSWFIQTTGTE